jgi:hypothetical protein
MSVEDTDGIFYKTDHGIEQGKAIIATQIVAVNISSLKHAAVYQSRPCRAREQGGLGGIPYPLLPQRNVCDGRVAQDAIGRNEKIRGRSRVYVLPEAIEGGAIKILVSVVNIGLNQNERTHWLGGIGMKLKRNNALNIIYKAKF